MSGIEMYKAFLAAKKSSSFKQRAALVQLQFAEEAVKSAKKADEEKAEEKEDYGNDKDTEKDEKKVQKTESETKDGKGKKEFSSKKSTKLAEEKEEEDEEEKKESKEELAEDDGISPHMKKYFEEHCKSLEDRLHGRIAELEETMGNTLEMLSKHK